MKRQRIDLHNELCAILGTKNAYFQPPESLKLTYPCFVYSRNPGFISRANNHLYNYEHNYQLTYITKDSETGIPLSVLKHFQKCSYDRVFVSDNLYHHIFDLYY